MRRLILFLLLLSMSACAPAGQGVMTAGRDLPVQAIQPEYRLNPGDVLDIKFFYNPELNETVMVRPDGRISLQLANETMAAGLTPDELRKSLTERYGKEINKPELTIIVRSFSMQRVYIDGEVARPGMLPLVGPVTIHQAIAAAGGFRETARRTDVIIIRQVQGKPVPLKVNMEEVQNNQDPSQDVLLAPFDIVYVPRSNIAEVNKFVDLYIRRNLPVGAGVGVGWTLNGNSSGR
ncbi:MAG: polysaccharide biosynthesis/export family protein [Syntrophorhabdales bacterium]|jgi:protein involved in polysaccharide export with SLBB domain